MIVSLSIAFLAGLISFVSPCVLPLIPGYVSFICGTTLNDLDLKSKNFILKNINLKITKGDTIGIFGDSGSGKSTLLEIFLGLLKISEGDIKINNNIS